ncbi:unnamed protein product [Cylicocyclus nassatus]|uniref:7TM GPCR serpentine receptor class x (Srx) domain-containing protein n=1 Tax=Cylicocyclus nassatus TaxID=53992 RepID=A0AA36DW31_CYLNA|nr:unnamed protein product [Cylicocyclus nassatus]
MWRWITVGSHWGKTFIYVDKCGIIIMIITFVLDVVAVAKFRKANKVFSNNASMFMSEAQKRKRRMEIKFFKQALCQNGLSLIAFISYHFISPLFADRWLVFLTSTFVWQLLHVFDGIVVLLFHFQPAMWRTILEKFISALAPL